VKGEKTMEKRGRGRPVGTLQDKLSCQYCKELKPREEFYKCTGSNTGRTHVCIGCNTTFKSEQMFRKMLKTKGREAVANLLQKRIDQADVMVKVLKEARE
jgi:hypothetical protein